MKNIILAACLATGAMAASAQNIDIQIGQSDYYGRIDLMNFGTPQLIYKEPMWIDRPANYRTIAPVYLRVPPGHAKNWSKHCAKYDACGRPAYFVQDTWYSNTYAPRYQKAHGGGKHKDRDDGRDFRLSDRPSIDYARHEREEEARGHGKDKGHKDKGHKDKGDKGGKGHGHGNGKH